MSLSLQFLSLLTMIGTGIVTAAFIDMIGTGTAHAGKKSLLRRRAAVFEIIGWILAGCWTFYILFLVRDGEWRIYDPFAQMSGILLYASFFHKPFRLFGRFLLVIFIKPLWFIISMLFSVVRYVVLLIYGIIIFLFKPLIKIFRKYYRKAFKNRKK